MHFTWLASTSFPPEDGIVESQVDFTFLAQHLSMRVGIFATKRRLIGMENLGLIKASAFALVDQAPDVQHIQDPSVAPPNRRNLWLTPLISTFLDHSHVIARRAGV